MQIKNVVIADAILTTFLYNNIWQRILYKKKLFLKTGGKTNGNYVVFCVGFCGEFFKGMIEK